MSLCESISTLTVSHRKEHPWIERVTGRQRSVPLKKNRRKKSIRFGAYILSVLLSAILIPDTTAFAYADEIKPPKISCWPVPLSENTEETVSKNTLKVKAIGKNDPQGTPLTELVLTDLDEPEAEKPYDKTATVTSHEKIS